MIIIDSCGWLEFYTDGPLVNKYAPYLNDLQAIVTPDIIIYEVYKKIKRERSEADALLAIGPLHKTNVVPLDTQLVLLAADLSLEFGLPMADAFVYATSRLYKCKVITSDKHFKDLEDVIYFPKT
ncbi:MAG: hypothetical protein PWP65_662 [Clostridia bacterium]|nr:hypothetical protein [Clostridia bacterium]